MSDQIYTKKELKWSGIYAITNQSGFKKYIGQAKNIGKRWENHRNELRNNTHHNPYLQNAWNKYGESYFKFEVIQFCDEADLDINEQYWIERLQPEYNISKNVWERKHRDRNKYADKEEETFV